MFHYRAAEALLTLIQRQAAARGIDLDMGDSVVLDGDAVAEIEDQDPQRLAKVTAHAIARVADRFPLARRFSRHLEGRERRAGILSDVGAAVVCLYHRNPQAMEQLAFGLKDEVQAARVRRAAAKQQGPTGTNGAGNPDHITPQEGIINA